MIKTQEILVCTNTVQNLTLNYFPSFYDKEFITNNYHYVIENQ